MTSAITRGALKRPRASLTHSAKLACLVALLAACAAPGARADSASTADITSHVLVGMKPNQGFEVTCEDSVLYSDPVVSDESGIMEFAVDQRYDPLPSTIHVRIPAPPMITGEHACVVTDTSASVCWQTDRPATSQIEYGTTSAYGHTTPLNSTLTLEHEVLIEPLDAESTYHYRMISSDAFGNETVSGDRTLTTLPLRPTIADLSVTDLAANCFTVSWTTSRPCDAQVEYGPTDAYGETTPLEPELVTEHEVTIGGLASLTTYHFRAWSTDEFGRPVHSEDNVVTTLAPELLIFDVDVPDTTSSSATVTWSTTNRATSWVIYGLDAAYGQAEGNDEFVTEHVVVLSELEADTLYYFRVVSVDSTGVAEESGDYTFRTKRGPLEITDALIDDVTETTITIRWTTNRPADSQVEYGPDEEYGSATDILPSAVVEHSVTIEDLAPATGYHLRAWSADDFGYTAVSEDLVATTLAPELVVFGVAVPETTATTARVAWQTTNPAICWVEYGLGASYGFSSPANAHPVTEHAVVLADLAPRTQYHFRIHAADTHGQEATSADGTFTTRDQDGPGGVLIFGVVTTDVGPTFAVVTWQTNVQSSSTVEYGLTDACQLSVSDPEQTIDHRITLTALIPGARYYYRARSEDAGHHVAVSQTYTFLTPETDSTPPGVPGGLDARPCGSGVLLTWQPNEEPDLAGYRVYRRSEGAHSFAALADVLSSEVSYTDTDVLDGWSYDYRVAAVDAAGNESEPCESVRSVAGTNGAAKLWIYPNPVRHGTTISFSPPATAGDRSGTSYTLTIYDAGGRRVTAVARGLLTSDVGTVHWNATDATGAPVASGIYFCVVSFPNGSARSKVMVVR